MEIRRTENARQREIFTERVLPFTHRVFSTHLAPVYLSVDGHGMQRMNRGTSRIFQELSHWHNHRRSVNHKARPMKMTERQLFLANRLNQFFMAEMLDYAASLTNARGGILQPETIFQQEKKKAVPSKPTEIYHKFGEKKGSGKSCGKVKPTVRELAAASNERRRNESIDKQLQAWRSVKTDFDEKDDLATRYEKVKKYFAERPSDSSASLKAEILTYLLSILVEFWMTRCEVHEKDQSLHVVGLIWDMVCRISKMKEGVNSEIARYIIEIVKALRLPEVKLDIQTHRKTLRKSVQFTLPKLLKEGGLDIGLPATEFQLLHAGPFFDRNMGSAPDPRVRDFEPDEWQRKVLDEIDANKSLFVVAPTSAGKTFIS